VRASKLFDDFLRKKARHMNVRERDVDRLSVIKNLIADRRTDSEILAMLETIYTPENIQANPRFVINDPDRKYYYPKSNEESYGVGPGYDMRERTPPRAMPAAPPTKSWFPFGRGGRRSRRGKRNSKKSRRRSKK